jgi:hypothetical protein
VVMAEGRITAVLAADVATQESIIALATHPDDSPLAAAGTDNHEEDAR